PAAGQGSDSNYSPKSIAILGWFP
ncbi:MAG: hypothetical protein RL014_1040, partial [Pseudomonadota bacterium]